MIDVVNFLFLFQSSHYQTNSILHLYPQIAHIHSDPLFVTFMPTNDSQRTGPATRRARRRQRHRVKKISTKFPHRQRNYRRFMPKRQLLEQPSDIDDCFEDCQEFGVQLDPDIHVGNDAAQRKAQTASCSV